MAYPILYKANETNFEHLGVSVLSDASKCFVSREKNGIYILEFKYPVNGKDVDKIKEGMYIKTDAGYRTKNQRFVVSKITKTQNEFKIYCQHISQVKTTMNAIRPDISVTGSALMALSTWRDNLLDSRDEFFVQSDITTVNSTTWKVETIENARDALGGKAGSILDVWGGEYEFDNLNITLHKSMGIDNPTIIAYGKNLLDLEQEQSILETYTSVFPFKKYTDDNNREQLITLPEILLDSTHLNKFTHRRILKVDFSSDENIKTVEQLRSKAESYIKSNNVGVPKTNLKINYQDLSKVEGVFDNPALEEVDLCDRLKVYYSELGIMNESAKVVKVVWDVILEENHEIEVGDGRSSFTDSTSAKLESLQAQNDSVVARINALISEQEAAYDRFFKEKSKVIEDKVKDGYEKALLSSEEKIRKMGEAFDEKLAPIRNQVSTTVENYNRQFQATNLEISKTRVEATKQIQALSDRVNNMQDISSNSTVVELRGLVNGATSKITELETSVTREFTAVKKKNEDSLNAVKAEFTKGVNGLTSKVSSLEEYKNQDSSRTESLKQWVQRDTASQLSRERTEINKIIDNKGFVKNTEFSSKFTESARGITNQLSALETYKNQDGVRVANMQIWAQNNTANQLTAARRSIESWVNEKGYATTSVVENKVQETANSFSREISNVRNSVPTSVGGRNYVPNSGEPLQKEGHSWGGDWLVTTHAYYYNSNKKIMCLPNSTNTEKFIRSPRFKLKRNTDYVISFKGFASSNVSSMDLHVLGRRKNETSDFTIFTTPSPIINARKLSIHGLEIVKNIRFNSKEMDEAFLRFDNNGSTNNHSAALFIAEVKLEEGTISTDWTPAPEDDQQSINELNSWKQTATGTLNTVTSTLNDTVRHAQLRIGADKIDFGSNKVFDGRNLASMLSVSPESIQAISDRVIISPSNENLVKLDFRESAISSNRDIWITSEITSDKLNNGDQFIIEGIGTWSGTLRHDLNFIIAVKYKSGNWTWITSRLKARGEYSNSIIPLKTTLTINGLNEEVAMYRLGLQQPDWSNFTNITFKNAKIYKKKSAELIVDGSIEGRQIKAETLETGHHKAGSITSDIIAANAVKAKHVLIDDGLIHNLITHNAFINKLWAQQAFINKLNAVKIKSTQIDTDTLNGVVISGQSKIKIGQYGFLQPITKGLQINAPENFGSKRGIGLQIAGEGVGPKESGVPPGLFIYEDPDFTQGNTVPSAVNRVLLTVAGMACFSSRILGSVVKGQPILTNLDYSSPFSNHAPVKFIGYKEGGLMRFFSTDNSNSDIWNIKVDQWGSDRKLKTDIKDSEFNAIEFVDKLKFKEHGWNKDEVGYDKPYTKCGLIAQELQELDKSLVVDYETYLGLDALRLINIALKAVQELSQQNKELKNKLEEIING
nr:MAG TPA: tail protein [Caudoviricetes sp.]